jgi:hypothetical protein
MSVNLKLQNKARFVPRSKVYCGPPRTSHKAGTETVRTIGPASVYEAQRAIIAFVGIKANVCLSVCLYVQD